MRAQQPLRIAATDDKLNETRRIWHDNIRMELRSVFGRRMPTVQAVSRLHSLMQLNNVGGNSTESKEESVRRERAYNIRRWEDAVCLMPSKCEGTAELHDLLEMEACYHKARISVIRVQAVKNYL